MMMLPKYVKPVIIRVLRVMVQILLIVWFVLSLIIVLYQLPHPAYAMIITMMMEQTKRVHHVISRAKSVLDLQALSALLVIPPPLEVFIPDSVYALMDIIQPKVLKPALPATILAEIAQEQDSISVLAALVVLIDYTMLQIKLVFAMIGISTLESPLARLASIPALLVQELMRPIVKLVPPLITEPSVQDNVFAIQGSMTIILNQYAKQ